MSKNKYRKAMKKVNSPRKLKSLRLKKIMGQDIERAIQIKKLIKKINKEKNNLQTKHD